MITVRVFSYENQREPLICTEGNLPLETVYHTIAADTRWPQGADYYMTSGQLNFFAQADQLTDDMLAIMKTVINDTLGLRS